MIRIVHEIKKKLRPSRIYLFGSLSRGDFHELSDVDLVIVGDFKVPFFKRIGLVLDLNDTDLEVEPLVYTEEEFIKMKEEGNFFILHVLKESIEISN
ncbi:MAG: nucleotidyltransferase domain-containing protein [Candidatus Helarchaeales archaeon]